VRFFYNELPPNQRDRKSPNFLPWDPAGTGRVSAVGRCRVKSPPDIVRLGLVRRMLVVGSRAPPCLACRALRTAAACAGRGHARLRRYCCESEAAAERRWAEPSSAGRRCRGREQPSQRARARCSEEHRRPAALYRAIESRGWDAAERACRVPRWAQATLPRGERSPTPSLYGGEALGGHSRDRRRRRQEKRRGWCRMEPGGAAPGNSVEGRLWTRLRRACDCCSALRRRLLGVASAAPRLLRHRDEPGRGRWLLMRRSVGAGAASVLAGARPRAASMGAGTARGPRTGARHTPSVSRVRGRIAPEFAGAMLRLRSPCRCNLVFFFLRTTVPSVVVPVAFRSEESSVRDNVFREEVLRTNELMLSLMNKGYLYPWNRCHIMAVYKVRVSSERHSVWTK
jgi:hypothetical protein